VCLSAAFNFLDEKCSRVFDCKIIRCRPWWTISIRPEPVFVNLWRSIKNKLLVVRGLMAFFRISFLACCDIFGHNFHFLLWNYSKWYGILKIKKTLNENLYHFILGHRSMFLQYCTMHTFYWLLGRREKIHKRGLLGDFLNILKWIKFKMFEEFWRGATE